MERPREGWEAIVRGIDEIKQALDDPEATFTAEEVRKLVDWEVMHATQSEYHRSRVVAVQQRAAREAEAREKAYEAMQKAISEREQPQLVLKVIKYDEG